MAALAYERITPLQTIRIALFSQRNKPLLSTIISMTFQPKYEFTLDDSIDVRVGAIDIAIVNASDTVARAQLAKALIAKPSIQVLHLARDETELEPASNGTKHFMLHKHLMADLVASLNRFASNVPAPPPRDPRDITAPLPAGPTPAERAAAARAAVSVAMPKSASPQPQQASASTQPPLRHQARRHLRALMVDSNPTVHAQLREVIESIGMRCDTAKSGAEAVKQLIGNTYNIVYIDATSPHLDGYKLSRAIKSNQNHKTTAVILLTSRDVPFDAVRGAAVGCDSYIIKPIELKKFHTVTVAALSENIDANEVSSLTRDPTVTLPVKKK